MGEELTLQGMLLTLIRGWWIVVLVTLVVLVATAAWLKARQPQYAAGMTIAPAELDLGVTDSLVQDLEQFANLATLSQLPEKLERISPMERYEAMIRSPQLAERLQEEPGIMQVIFRADWDEESQRWREPPDLLDGLYHGALRFFGFPGWTEPDAVNLAEHLQRRFSLFQPRGTAMRRLRYVHPNPGFAVALLEKVHTIAEDLLREGARRRTTAQIVELEETLADPTLAPARRAALETVLAKHYQTDVLLQADTPYAAEVVMPARSSPTPISTNPILVLALAGVIGAILGIFVVFLRAAFR
jgi:capsular polysaccharide biosynthesis protein